MKKYLALFAAAAFLAVCGVGTATAGVQGTAHATSIGNQGYCSACHMPHKSPSDKRLWPSPMTTVSTTMNIGEVGNLCYYCHGSGGGKDDANSLQMNVLDDVQGEFSHKHIMVNIPGAEDMANSGLPYVGNAVEIECTTCHNVHEDANRPFLRANLDVICAYCHTGRMFAAGSAYTVGDPLGAWGARLGEGDGTTTGNPGSHPVGTDVDNDSDANSPIDLTGTRVNVPKNAGVGGWSLGGHNASPQGMTCTTCHAVHGYQPDADPAPSAADPTTAATVDLLAVDQDPTDGQNDGDGLAANILCETCHVEGTDGIWDPVSGAYAGSNNPNPGATAYTHPVDDLGSANTAGVTAFGDASWPVGATAGSNMDPAVVCESCHTPHPYADDGTLHGADYVMVAAGTHILRAAEADICGLCHNGGMADHHPTGTYDTTDFTTDATAMIGDNASPLTCGDCHNGSGAHNWTLPSGVGLDPDWVPANNGRVAGADTQVGEVNVGTSETCEECHSGNYAHFSPTVFVGSGNTVPGTPTYDGATRTRGDYQDTGDGSHFLGTIDATVFDYANGTLDDGSTTFNATNGTWTAGGWSRFDDADAGHMVCESCHDVEPDKNATGTALLLHYYSDGEAGLDPSDFCQGCHSNKPGGGTPHPMTADTISRAALDADEATKSLVTSGRYSKALASWTGSATAPAADSLNCDSCHQPHDTDDDGGTYIYETDDATLVTSTTAPAGDGTTGHPGRGEDAVSIQDINFCNQCHEY